MSKVFLYGWERLAAVVGMLVGIGALVVGWYGVSGADLTTEQIPYLASGAVAGLFALGVAGTLWISADLRDEFAKLDEIHEILSSLDREEHPTAPTNRPLRAGVFEPTRQAHASAGGNS